METTQQVEEITEEITDVIPENSETLLIDRTTSRFNSATWFDKIQEKTIVLAGVGGIGSWAAMLLARLKPTSLFIYDDDVVEAANMSGQLYSVSNIGQYKVTALVNTVRDYTDFHSIFAIEEKYTPETSASDIMICGFDNMEARRVFFSNWENHVQNKPKEEQANCLFIDGRLNAEEFQIFCIQGNDSYNINKYIEDFLFSDKEVEDTVCSYKQTSFCASMIASYMVNLFVNFCANQAGAYRELPFLTSYNAEIMYLKTES